MRLCQTWMRRDTGPGLSASPPKATSCTHVAGNPYDNHSKGVGEQLSLTPSKPPTGRAQGIFFCEKGLFCCGGGTGFWECTSRPFLFSELKTFYTSLQSYSQDLQHDNMTPYVLNALCSIVCWRRRRSSTVHLWQAPTSLACQAS